MKVVQILNHCAVLAEDFYGSRKIILAKDIGILCSLSDIVPKELLKEAVIFESNDFRNYRKLMDQIPNEYFEAVFEIVSFAQEKLHKKLNPQIHLVLTDHIYFAVKRKRKNILFYDPNIANVKKIYPQEYSIALESLKKIKEILNEELPEEEASCLVFHLVNSEQGTSIDLFETADIIQNIMTIIKFFYGREPDISSMQYSRFVGYFHLLLQRMKEKKPIASGDLFLEQQAKQKYSKEMKCISRMDTYLQKIFTTSLPDTEKIHLAVYLRRMMEEEE